MADFEPTTDIKLLAVPLANDGESTLTFSSKSAQSAYFSSKVVGSFPRVILHIRGKTTQCVYRGTLKSYST